MVTIEFARSTAENYGCLISVYQEDGTSVVNSLVANHGYTHNNGIAYARGDFESDMHMRKWARETVAWLISTVCMMQHGIRMEPGKVTSDDFDDATDRFSQQTFSITIGKEVPVPA